MRQYVNVVSKLKASRPVAVVVVRITARNTRERELLRIAHQKVTLRWKAMRVGRRGLG